MAEYKNQLIKLYKYQTNLTYKKLAQQDLESFTVTTTKLIIHTILLYSTQSNMHAHITIYNK